MPLPVPEPANDPNPYQMLSQRLLTRRLPQLAARSAVPRASFSQARILAAEAEVADTFQVRCVSLEEYRSTVQVN